MGKRFLSILLVFALMLGLGLPVRASNGAEAQSVVYIPLDDRPFNDQRVRLMAQSLGIELIMPDTDLYATKLDGQAPNSNGTQYGNREALLQWLMEMDRQYDTFILSLDQLLSGGLMNSRCMEENQPLILSDSTMTEYEVIDYLAILARNNTVYIIDSVMRLATSCGFGGYDLDHYTVFRLYGMMTRPVLSGNHLTADQIVDTYRLGLNGKPAYQSAGFTQSELETLLSPIELYRDQNTDPDMEAAYLAGEDPTALLPAAMDAETVAAMNVSEDPDSALSHYLKIRERKLRLSEYALKRLSGLRGIHYLLGIDDSSEGNNIQTNEIALFSQYLTGSNHLISSSLDGLGQMALSKLYLEQHQTSTPRVQVTYYGDKADTIPNFNNASIRNMVNQTLAYLGTEQVSSDPDLSVLVVTACNSQDSRRKDLLDLVSRLNENEYDQIPTILIDASSNQEPMLNQLLTENVHLSMLLSFSGQYENPNYTTMALIQGLARYQSLLSSDQTEEAQAAHLENLFSALIKEIAYTDSAAVSVGDFLKDMGLSPQNFGTLDQATRTRVEDMLTEKVCSAAEGLLQNLSGNYISSLSPYSRQSVSRVTIDRCSFPWLRQSDISLSMTLTLSSTETETGTFHRAYINGVTDSTFAPYGKLNRAQAVKMIVTAGALTTSLTNDPFPDMVDWAKPYILAAYQAGLVSGYPDGTYRPNNIISRAEFSVMVYRLAQNQNISLPSSANVSFSDVAQSGQWYSTAVYTLAGAGILKGYPGNLFMPSAPITRTEAVTVLNRLFGRTEDLSQSMMTLGRFSDVAQDWGYSSIQEASVSHFCKD